MKQTPIHDRFNPDVLAIMPKNASRVVEVVPFECHGEVSHALVLRLHVTDALRHAPLELLPALGVAGGLVAVVDARVDDDERSLRRDGRYSPATVAESLPTE